VQLKDGRILRGRSPEHYRGGPQNPLTREELAEKFNDCVQRILKAGSSQDTDGSHRILREFGFYSEADRDDCRAAVMAGANTLI
jgi:hypothetical protein